MRSLERKIRQPVIELHRIETHDVRVTALVLGVAAAALTVAGIRHAAVEPGGFAHIGRNILVTVETQCGLGPAVAAVVAVGAGFFLFDMRAADLAGHQERFHGAGLRHVRRSRGQ